MRKTTVLELQFLQVCLKKKRKYLLNVQAVDIRISAGINQTKLIGHQTFLNIRTC